MGRMSNAAKAAAQAAQAAQTEQATETPSAPLQAAQADPVEPGDRYLVQWGVKFNGHRYGEGDTVQMSAEDAAPFLASGAITKG